MTGDRGTQDALDAAIDREVAAMTDVSGMAAASQARAVARLAGRESRAWGAWRPAVALGGAVGCAALVWWLTVPGPAVRDDTPAPVVAERAPVSPGADPERRTVSEPAAVDTAPAARASRPTALPRRAAPQPIPEELPPLVEPIALAPIETPAAIPVADIGVASVELKPILVEAIAMPPVDAAEPQR